MSTTIQNQICEATETIVAFRTTDDSPEVQQRCLEEIASMVANDLQATYYMFHGRPALVLSNCDEKELDIIISGHIDVVPGNSALFSMRKKEGLLYGRGVYDMKGPLMAALFAVRDAVRAGLQKRVGVLITADEETDGRGTRALLEQVGYRARFAIIPDGGDESHIVTAQKGFLQLSVHFPGQSTHASRPWDGKNPIENAVTFVQQLTERFPIPAGVTDWETSVTPTKIEGGIMLNQTPESVTVSLDIRFTDSADVNTLTQWIDGTFADQGVYWKRIAENGMFVVAHDDQELLSFKKILEQQIGSEVAFVRECGTSDAIFFTEYEIPAALFRPHGGGDHGNDEWVSIVSLEQVYATLVDYLMVEK